MEPHALPSQRSRCGGAAAVTAEPPAEIVRQDQQDVGPRLAATTVGDNSRISAKAYHAPKRHGFQAHETVVRSPEPILLRGPLLLSDHLTLPTGQTSRVMHSA
jgi:hypothetical protein